MDIQEDGIEMNGVMEYCEGMNVRIKKTDGVYVFNGKREDFIGRGRLVIMAKNEAGHNSTEVDLLQLIEWIKANMPELIA